MEEAVFALILAEQGEHMQRCRSLKAQDMWDTLHELRR